jgi:phage-related protein
MALVSLTPPIDPTVQTQAAFTATVLLASFGDGYEQGVAVGFDNVRGQYTLQWDILTTEQRDDIEGFFTNQGGTTFQYTLPTESTPRFFKCRSWKRGQNGALYTLSADLSEVFS